MAKVLPLEGPHVKHHDHGKDASVPAHGKGVAIPQAFRELHIPCAEGGDTPAGAFLPKRSKDRPQPHQKVNETDH